MPPYSCSRNVLNFWMLSKDIISSWWNFGEQPSLFKLFTASWPLCSSLAKRHEEKPKILTVNNIVLLKVAIVLFCYTKRTLVTCKYIFYDGGSIWSRALNVQWEVWTSSPTLTANCVCFYYNSLKLKSSTTLVNSQLFLFTVQSQLRHYLCIVFNLLLLTV